MIKKTTIKKKNYNYNETILSLNKYKIEYHEKIKKNNVVI